MHTKAAGGDLVDQHNSTSGSAFSCIQTAAEGNLVDQNEFGLGVGLLLLTNFKKTVEGNMVDQNKSTSVSASMEVVREDQVEHVEASHSNASWLEVLCDTSWSCVTYPFVHLVAI